MGASAKALKIRIKSVKSTEHITRAMQLVASSKLRRATERMDKGRNYFATMQDLFLKIAEQGNDMESVYYKPATSDGKTCMIVIAGDRGLAGGYNNNVINLTRALCTDKQQVEILPIGKKSFEYFSKKGYALFDESLHTVDDMTLNECEELSEKVVKAYIAGKFDKVVIVYTNFVNMLSQAPASIQVLPLEKPSSIQSERSFTLYEPSPAAVLRSIIPEYVSGMIYCAMSESAAAEQAARRNAMDSATKNADEMIQKLSLQYNRARQGAITQEITEIVAGSEQ